MTDDMKKGFLLESLLAIPPVLACGALSYVLGEMTGCSSDVSREIPGGLNFTHHLAGGAGILAGFTDSATRRIGTLAMLGLSLSPEIAALSEGRNYAEISSAAASKLIVYGLGCLVGKVGSYSQDYF